MPCVGEEPFARDDGQEMAKLCRALALISEIAISSVGDDLFDGKLENVVLRRFPKAQKGHVRLLVSGWAVEWGSPSHPAACSFGTTYLRHVSASDGLL
jgi:hypothetical protein